MFIESPTPESRLLQNGQNDRGSHIADSRNNNMLNLENFITVRVYLNINNDMSNEYFSKLYESQVQGTQSANEYMMQ